MTRLEAEALTERIKVAAGSLLELLEEAHRRNAWKVLGYTSWEQYVRHQFDMSRSRSYQLLDQAKVIHEIQGASQMSTMVDIPERGARRLKPHLAEVKAEIHGAIEEGVEPHVAVSVTLKKFNTLPSPSEARELARETNTFVIGSDDVYHDGRTDDERQLSKEEISRRSRLYESLQTLSEMALSLSEALKSEKFRYERVV